MKDSEILYEALRKYESSDIQSLYAEFGEEITARIIDIFGGGVIYIPLKSTIMKEYISECVKRECTDSSDYFKIAQKYGISARTVRRIVDRKGR